MSAADVSIIPNIVVQQAEAQKAPPTTDIENEILRRNNKNQEMTIVELRGQCQNMANQLAGLKLENELKHKMNKELNLEIVDLRAIVRLKDEALRAANDCIEHMNLKDRLFVRMVDERFQRSIADS